MKIRVFRPPGIGYSLGRVPIASTDFSVREYSYLDTPNDFDLSTFGLAKEDMEDKARNNLKNFAKIYVFRFPIFWRQGE